MQDTSPSEAGIHSLGTRRVATSAPDRESRDTPGVIVVGYDGSDESTVAVRWAAEQASRDSRRLRVVRAWRMREVWDEGIANNDVGVVPPMSELEELARGRLAAAVDKLVGDTDLDLELQLGRGPDAAGILLGAAERADLLVLGSRGRGRVATALLGSVTSRCIEESPCPVLVIPHRMAVPADIEPRNEGRGHRAG